MPYKFRDSSFSSIAFFNPYIVILHPSPCRGMSLIVKAMPLVEAESSVVGGRE
jgi:hypothetical protein